MIYFCQILILFVFVFNVSTRSLDRIAELTQSLEVLGTYKNRGRFDKCGPADIPPEKLTTPFKTPRAEGKRVIANEVSYDDFITYRQSLEMCSGWCDTGALRELRKYRFDKSNPKAFEAMYKTLLCCSDQPDNSGERRLVHLSILSCLVSDDGKRANFLIPNYYYFEDKDTELHSEIIALCYAWGNLGLQEDQCVIISQAKPCSWCQRASIVSPTAQFQNYDHQHTYTLYPIKNSCVWSFTHQVSDLLRQFIIETHSADHQAITAAEDDLEKANRRACMSAFNFYDFKFNCLGQTDPGFFTEESGVVVDDQGKQRFTGQFSLPVFPWSRHGMDYIGNNPLLSLSPTTCQKIDEGKNDDDSFILRKNMMIGGNRNVMNILRGTKYAETITKFRTELLDPQMI